MGGYPEICENVRYVDRDNFRVPLAREYSHVSLCDELEKWEYCTFVDRSHPYKESSVPRKNATKTTTTTEMSDKPLDKEQRDAEVALDNDAQKGRQPGKKSARGVEQGSCLRRKTDLSG